MSATDTTGTGTGSGTGLGSGAERGLLDVLRQGFRLSPEFVQGLGWTVGLALLATCGRVLVPITVQQTLDRGVTPEQTRPGLVLVLVLVALAGLVVTGVASYFSNVRLFRATESGLATLRTTAFRHVHDLSVLTQNTERRGALVSRVTSDVDTISTFVQWGGLLLVLSTGQLLVATVLMAVYSWQLTLLVWAAFLPLFLVIPRLQKRVSLAYGLVRRRVGETLGAVAESVVGADTIRAYGVQDRTQSRIDEAIDAQRSAATRAQFLVAFSTTAGALTSGLVVAAVVLVGTLVGVDGDLTLGRLVAVLFLLQLFTTPVQMGTEVLNELQNAAAGWRRILGVMDTPAEVTEPETGAVELPRGPVTVRFEEVGYAYPGGAPVLTDVTLDLPSGSRVAVVGETGSGKTTLAKLLTRLMDPTQGRVLLDGVDLRRVATRSLRERVVMVPQEGFLFDLDLAANVAWARDGAGEDDVRRVLAQLGLLGWAESLAHGLHTAVGPRGESLSAGERQLVALARAALADPDLLVLDEATSAVDPATEVALQRALDGVTRGRTSVTIAHRLSTAEAADLVVVVDAGRVVDAGSHRELLGRSEIYQGLHASWTAHTAAV
ncbi:ABC transporter ATP-binding protein [Spongisporangium articulatum]|uniref:ABC transporter ATP-binding protein n=1 Tax=Spongisporangium articulatum TaxID=3362603 RepID=A0ABW8ARC9_9ACTN